MSEATPAEIHSHLEDVQYPATRDQLVAAAARGGADDQLLQRLRNIDGVELYDSPEAVSAAVTFEGGTSTDYGHVTVYDQ